MKSFLGNFYRHLAIFNGHTENGLNFATHFFLKSQNPAGHNEKKKLESETLHYFTH